MPSCSEIDRHRMTRLFPVSDGRSVNASGVGALNPERHAVVLIAARAPTLFIHRNAILEKPMFKKLLVAVVGMIASIGFAFAQVDVNKADQAALEGVKGIGPSISKKIIDERTKGGAFKDWSDFETRVKGIGTKNAVKLSQGGLTVNSQALPNAPATPAPKAASATKPEAAAKATAPAMKAPMTPMATTKPAMPVPAAAPTAAAASAPAAPAAPATPAAAPAPSAKEAKAMAKAEKAKAKEDKKAKAMADKEMAKSAKAGDKPMAAPAGTDNASMPVKK
jgi:competence protein ComEA